MHIRMMALFFCLMGYALPAFGAQETTPEQPTQKKSECLQVNQLTGFSYVDPYHAFFIGRTPRENYLVEFTRKCRDLNFTNVIVTSFEYDLVCSPQLETVRTKTDLCPMRSIIPVRSKKEADAIAKGRVIERNARIAVAKAKKDMQKPRTKPPAK